MIRNRSHLESYPDGDVRIYAVSEQATAGGMPQKMLTLKESLRYRRRTVGNQRYYNAMQVGVIVSAVLRCPYRPTVSGQDVAVLESGSQYKIRQVQEIEGSNPRSMDLTLEEVRQAYVVQ